MISVGGRDVVVTAEKLQKIYEAIRGPVLDARMYVAESRMPPSTARDVDQRLSQLAGEIRDKVERELGPTV